MATSNEREGMQVGDLKREKVSKKRVVLLRDMFPYLWSSPNTAEDIRAVLKMTSTELGSKLKRGKKLSMTKLRNLENELEVSALRAKLDDHKKIFDLLNDLPCQHGSILDVSRIVPSALDEAETIFSLAGVFVGRQLQVGEFTLEKCLKLLSEFELDEVDVSIFRGQVSALTDSTSVIKIAKQYKLSRQSVNQRRLGIFENVKKLESAIEFKSLTKFLRRRGMQSNSAFEFSPEDTLVTIHSVQSSAEFPTVVDVVNAALWLLQQEVGKIALRSAKT